MAGNKFTGGVSRKDQAAKAGGMNMQALMEQARKMQDDMAAAEEELSQKSYTATSGGGVVSATIDGSGRVSDLVIKPELCDADEVEMLQDLVIAAINEAVEQKEQDQKTTMDAISANSGMPSIPGLF